MDKIDNVVPISLNSSIEYEIPREREYTWILVRNLAIQIKQEPEGIVIDVWPRKDGTSDDVIATTYAFWNDAPE